MVQIHEAPQSFGSGLIQSLGNAGVKVAKGIQQRNANQALNKLLNEAEKNQNPQIDTQGNLVQSAPTQTAKPRVNTSAIYDAAIRAGLTPEQAKMKVQPYLDKEKFEQQRQLQNERFAHEDLKASEKHKLEKKEKAEEILSENSEWERVVGDLNDNLKYVGNRAFVPGAFLPFTEAAEKREEFDVNAFQLERAARAAHTKGALSTRVYESLLSKIPNSKLSEAQNKGRIKAWEKAFIKNPEVLDKLRKEAGVEAPKEKLTKNTAQDFLNQAKGDKKEAQRLAKEAGYKW